MTTKYQVTDSKGQLHKRVTKDRTYTHAVVYHIPAQPAGNGWKARDAYSKASWCGRADLAHKEANVWCRHGWAVEIIPVVEA